MPARRTSAFCLGPLMSKLKLFRLSLSLLTAAILLSLLASPPVLAKKAVAVQTPQQAQAWEFFVQGTQLLEERKPFKARKVLEQASRLWPNSAPIRYNLGFCYHDCGLFELAIGEFEQALRLDPKMSGCITNIANSYQQMGRTREAINWLNAYLKSNPKDPEQTRGLISALEHVESEQILSDPKAPDYLPSVCKQGKPQRWPLAKMPLRVFFSNGADEAGKKVKGFKEEYLVILKDALEEWMKATGNKVSYVAVGDHQSANIICTWTDDLAFPRQTNNKAEQGLAHVIYHDTGDDTKQIDQVHLTVLVLDRQTAKPLSDDEMKMVCLHELGHALGLNGHSPNNRDVMFFSMSPSVWPVLTKRDKATLYRLYEDFPERQILQAHP